jgi:hypothetical protein
MEIESPAGVASEWRKNCGRFATASCFFGAFASEVRRDEFRNPIQHFRRPLQVSVPQCISRDPNQSCYLATGSTGDALRGSAQVP